MFKRGCRNDRRFDVLGVGMMTDILVPTDSISPLFCKNHPFCHDKIVGLQKVIIFHETAVKLSFLTWFQYEDKNTDKKTNKHKDRQKMFRDSSPGRTLNRLITAKIGRGRVRRPFYCVLRLGYLKIKQRAKKQRATSGAQTFLDPCVVVPRAVEMHGQ